LAERSTINALDEPNGVAGMPPTRRPNTSSTQESPMPDIITTDVEFAANGGTDTGYLARPDDGGTHPGVIVIQEWWGLDAHIKSIADRFAREGFVALAPDLYHGAVATEPDEARKLVMGLNRAQALKDVLGAVRHLQSLDAVAPKKVGSIGFCMGGAMTLALAAATADVAAAAPFYGGAPAVEDVPKIKAQLLIQLASEDARVNAGWPAYETALEAAGIPYTMHMYEGAQHGFNNDTTPRYDEKSATLAWERTVAFFNAHLR
jgi:carboxymethylenebutenolidase